MTISDERVVADRLDLEMLERPRLWPGRHMGFPCVMLRTEDKHKTAKCIMEDASTWLVMAFDWSGPRPTEPELERYTSAEAVTAAGWRVD